MGTIDKTDSYCISDEDYEAVNKRSKVHQWDVLFSMIGTVGNVCLIETPDDEIDFAIKNMGCFSCGNERKARWLYYYLQSPYARKLIQNELNGAIQKFLPLGWLRDLEIPECTLDNDKIVDILSTIDCKIALNNSICTDLEAMAKQIYDYWFVQFDFPDENGKPYKSSGGKMVWCEELNREIPEGWEVKKVSDIGMLETNSVFPDKDTIYSHYSIPSFDESKTPAAEDGKDIASNKYIVPDNCILVSKLNPQFKRIWLVRKSSENAICSTEFLPVVANENDIAYLFAVLYSEAFSVYLQQKASSSTGRRKRIDPENCMSFQFAYDKATAAKYNQKMLRLFDQVVDIPSENQQLASLRDFLLPMLMNGQIKVGA